MLEFVTMHLYPINDERCLEGAHIAIVRTGMKCWQFLISYGQIVAAAAPDDGFVKLATTGAKSWSHIYRFHSLAVVGTCGRSRFTREMWVAMPVTTFEQLNSTLRMDCQFPEPNKMNDITVFLPRVFWRELPL